MPASFPASTFANTIQKITGYDAGHLTLAGNAISEAQKWQPDVVHFFGASLLLNLVAYFWLWHNRPPTFLHYHGGLPSTKKWLRAMVRWSFGQAERILMTTKAQAEPFINAGILPPNSPKITQLMEVSTPFTKQDKIFAQQKTDMQGDPIFLWTGRLHPLKDPLTALRGFAQIWQARPTAHLYLHYVTNELLEDLQSFVATIPNLHNHVHFRGHIAHDQIEMVYNSADFFLQASEREYSGYAVLEAMACAVIPVVTDIPAFRLMCDGGNAGILFPHGDHHTLTQQVLQLTPETRQQLAQRAHDRFNQTFSYAAMSTKLETLYENATK
jgi:glycosyltransferase involved in cell wall biosynthesis